MEHLSSDPQIHKYTIMTFSDFRAFVSELLPTVRAIALRHYDSVEVEYKADQSPVTVADREIETYMSEQIALHFPTHWIMGEEGANREGAEDWHWILDPIDGTKSFIHHIPLFTTLIGVMRGGQAVYGAIYNPILDELTVGDNNVAIHNGVECHVRPCKQLSDATLLSSDLYGFHRYRDGAKFEKLVLQCRVERSWGDGNGYQMVAMGRADIMADAKVSLWDVAAVLPVVRGAGALARGIHGEQPENADSLIVATPDLMPLIDL